MSVVSPLLTRPPLVRGVLLSQAASLATAALVATMVASQAPTGSTYVAKAIVAELVIASMVVLTIARSHPFDTVGPANVMTSIRAAFVAATAALIGEPATGALAAAASALAILVTVLDGVDGWLARRTRMASGFGARFDMEVDALLILSLALLAWTLGKAGAWIVVAGALRYLFIAAGSIWRWVAAPLPPSARRKAICVVQIVGLAVVVSPLLAVPGSTIVAAVTLAVLTWSFAIDTLWLRRHSA